MGSLPCHKLKTNNCNVTISCCNNSRDRVDGTSDKSDKSLSYFLKKHFVCCRCSQESNEISPQECACDEINCSHTKNISKHHE